MINLFLILIFLAFWLLVFRYAHFFPRISLMAGIFFIFMGVFEASFYFVGSKTGESAIGAGLALIFGMILLISGIVFIVGARRTNVPTLKRRTLLIWVAIILFLTIGMAHRTLV